MEKMLCPKCDTEIEQDTVDIGVGLQHRPLYCSCGYDELEEVEKLFKKKED